MRMNDLTALRSYLTYERGLQPSTVSRYTAVADHLTHFLAAKYGRVKWRRVTKERLVDFLLTELAEMRPSKPAWNNRVAALHALFDWLLESGRVKDNPAARILKVPTEPDERVPLSFEEAIGLVSVTRERSPAAYAGRNVALMQVLLHCGLRVSEVAGINLDQVDLDCHLFVDVVVKGGKCYSLRFNDVVREALEEYLPERAELALQGETALFLSSQRRRWSVRAIQYCIDDFGALAGIKRPVFPHLLRHSSATLLADVGKAAPTVVQKKHLHHKSLTTTDTYLHVTDCAYQAAIDRFGRAWKKAAAESANKACRGAEHQDQATA